MQLMEKEQMYTISGLIVGLIAFAFVFYWVSPGRVETMHWPAIIFEGLFFLFIFLWNVTVLPIWQSSKTLCLGSLFLLVGSFADVFDNFFIQPRWEDWFVENLSLTLDAGLFGWGIWLGVKEKEGLLEQLQKDRDLEKSVVPKLSHDLRIPLRNAMSMVRRLEDDPEVPPDSRWRESLDIILRGLKEVDLLLENLVDAHWLKSGKAELRPAVFDLAQLLDETCGTFQNLADHKAITIVKDFPQLEMMLEADRIKVMRILQNLLDNAIKFCFTGGKVTVRATEADGEITVRVSDEGPGLAQDQTDRFMQGVTLRLTLGAAASGRGTERAPESYGIGLKVVKEFVDLHGGRFWFEPNSPTGAQFYFTLPRSAGRKEKRA